MTSAKTKIGEIIDGLQCDDIALNPRTIFAGPLLKEIIHVAVVTYAFHLAQHSDKFLFISPYPAVKTKAGLVELLEFAQKDERYPWLADFCKGILTEAKKQLGTQFGKDDLVGYEDNMAMLTFGAYFKKFRKLSAATDCELPTTTEINHALKKALVERPEGKGESPIRFGLTLYIT